MDDSDRRARGLGAGQALEICRDAVAASSSDDVVARLHARRQGATRFANGGITQGVAHREATLRIRVAFGRRRGEVEVHRFDRDALREAVARAEAIARLAPEDAEHLPPVEPSAYREVPPGLSATADAAPSDRADAVARALAAAEGPGLSASGAFATSGDLVAFANSRGASGAFTSSDAEVHATVLGPTSSGWAREASRDRRDVDPERAVRRARALAELAADPRTIDPGEHRVVLAPAAAAELLVFLLLSADAKAADEGRSAFSGKDGHPVASDRVTIRSVLADPACPGAPFDADGAPLDDTTWIDRGVLRSLITTRFHAAATGRRHTPFPGSFAMDGTDQPDEALIAQVERGLYVTRFWYTRMVDPMTLLLTGMTRDGLFLIEDGEIVAGVKHLRWNDSPLRVLGAVADVGRAEVTHPWFLARVPSLLVDGFRFTSGTSF